MDHLQHLIVTRVALPGGQPAPGPSGQEELCVLVVPVGLSATRHAEHHLQREEDLLQPMVRIKAAIKALMRPVLAPEHDLNFSWVGCIKRI